MSHDEIFFGFVWDDKIIVRRLASSKNPRRRFWVLELRGPDGRTRRVTFTPKSTRVRLLRKSRCK